MRKEILFAIIIGVLLGSVILYGTFLANKATSNLSTSPTPSETNPPLADTPTPSNLKINFPYNNYVSFTDTINITGTCPPLSPIAITSETGDNIFKAGSDGSFNLEVKLIGGENSINLAIPSESGIDQTTLNIIYTTATIKIK